MSVGKGAFAAYRLAGSLAAPLAKPYLVRRSRRGKEDPARLHEKLGLAAPERTDGPIWVHAISVGESVAALALSERLIAAGHPVVLTTGTPASAERVAASPVPVIHRYAPLDAVPFVARFLDAAAPSAALFVEAEVWPATLHILAERAIPRAHVSARISERSFRRWSRRPSLAASLFGLIPLALAQSEADAERFAALGVPRTMATGNLKFDAPPPAVDDAALTTLAGALGERPRWLAASLHPGEEAAVIAAHRALSKTYGGLVTLAAPRHAETGRRLLAAANEASIPTAVRSAGEAPAPGIYVVDTMGELGTMFRLSPVTFLGGSLVPLGGHNPAEPAALGSAILTGPSVGPMFTPFLHAEAARVVADADALQNSVAMLLSDGLRAGEMAKRAQSVLEEERGALDRTLDALGPVLPRRREPA
ncbi:MAG: 3-deoxy-D-manno-octulosonic acid transferase [Pseudomonadota bacterium]